MSSYDLACLGMAVCILSGCTTSRDGDAAPQQGDAAPTISVEQSTYAPGENIVVAFANGPGNINDWIAIYVDGENTEGGDNDPNLKVWYYANGTHDAGEEGASNGRVVFDSGAENEENGVPDWPLPEGEYDIYLICCDGYDMLAGPAHFTIDSGDGS